MSDKMTFEEALLFTKMLSVSRKIDCANCKDFQESKTFEEYENRRGIIDINEEEFNFLKDPKLRDDRDDEDR